MAIGKAHGRHGIVKGNCGHVISRCRCIEGHKNVRFLAEACDACKKARALDLEPYSPPPPRDPKWPTL